MKELINSKILDIEIGNQEKVLRFTTDTNIFVYEAIGDCCSESWFSEIINLDFIINNIVVDVENLKLPKYNQIDGNCRQVIDKFYGINIATKMGQATIVFRNSSNGYYCGWYDLIKDLSFNKDNDKYNFKSIKHLSDWTAYEFTNNSYARTLKLKAFL